MRFPRTASLFRHATISTYRPEWFGPYRPKLNAASKFPFGVMMWTAPSFQEYFTSCAFSHDFPALKQLEVWNAQHSCEGCIGRDGDIRHWSSYQNVSDILHLKPAVTFHYTLLKEKKIRPTHTGLCAIESLASSFLSKLPGEPTYRVALLCRCATLRPRLSTALSCKQLARLAKWKAGAVSEPFV